MAVIQITEFREAAIIQGHALPVGKGELAVQNVTYTTATSTAFDTNTQFIRVLPIAADAYVDLTNTAATANSMILKADTPEYFGVNPGDQISIYDGTS